MPRYGSATDHIHPKLGDTQGLWIKSRYVSSAPTYPLKDRTPALQLLIIRKAALMCFGLGLVLGCAGVITDGLFGCRQAMSFWRYEWVTSGSE